MVPVRRFRLLALLAALPLLHCGAAPEQEMEAATDALSGEQCSSAECVPASGPAELTYAELTTLSALDGKRTGDHYAIPGAPRELEAKVNTLLTTPFVSNAAYFDGVRKHLPIDTEHALGPTMRAVQWNIERGQQLETILLAIKAANDPRARDAFYAHVKDEVKADAEKMATVTSELDALGNADLFILNEVDRGMHRSGYEDVAAKLGKELGMNYAYGVEFIEIDPLGLGTQKLEGKQFKDYDAKSGAEIDEDPAKLDALAKEANDALAVDTAKVKALHGNAILSRYPITRARLVPLKTPQTYESGCWDWNADEKKGPRSFADAWLKAGQDVVTSKVFLEETMRQTRMGGRTVLMVDLKVNGLDAPLTVVNAHIEARGTPKCRRSQMKEILDLVKDVRNPVIMGGDLNTTGKDGRPVTVRGLLEARFKNPEFYLKKIVPRLVPYAGWGFTAWDGLKFFKKLDDPTSLFSPEHALFGDLKNAGFDFRGEKARTVNGTEKTLADSNQRDTKGFKTSWSLERTLGPIGKMRLDWMLVRSFAATSANKRSYRFAPHFPRTLEELDMATEPRMSDHYPNVITLPLKDPCLGAAPGTCTVPDRIEEDDYTISELPAAAN